MSDMASLKDERRTRGFAFLFSHAREHFLCRESETFPKGLDEYNCHRLDSIRQHNELPRALQGSYPAREDTYTQSFVSSRYPQAAAWWGCRQHRLYNGVTWRASCYLHLGGGE